MERIQVMTGVRYKPEHLIETVSKKKKNRHLVLKYVCAIYRPCWIFEFRVLLRASGNTSRYAGYYAGMEEINMTPGKIQILPGAEEREVQDYAVLAKKCNEKAAVDIAWEYNKNWIAIKFKNLYVPPILEQYRTHLYYKILYVIEFYNQNRNEKNIWF